MTNGASSSLGRGADLRCVHFCPQASWYDSCTVSKRASQITKFAAGSAQTAWEAMAEVQKCSDTGSAARWNGEEPYQWYHLPKDKVQVTSTSSSNLLLLLSTCLRPGAHSNEYIDKKGIGFTYIIKYFILTCKAFSKFSFHEADNVKNLRCQPKSLKS